VQDGSLVCMDTGQRECIFVNAPLHHHARGEIHVGVPGLRNARLLLDVLREGGLGVHLVHEVLVLRVAV